MDELECYLVLTFHLFDGCFESGDSACVGRAVGHLGRQDTIGGSVGSEGRRGDLRRKRWQGVESNGSPRRSVAHASSPESRLSRGSFSTVRATTARWKRKLMEGLVGDPKVFSLLFYN